MTPDEFHACSVEAAAAIIAGNRLIARLNVEGAIGVAGENVNSWLLYAWTAESPAAAELAINRAIEIDPENQLAIAGQQWVRGVHDLVNTLVEQNDGRYESGDQSPSDLNQEQDEALRERSTAETVLEDEVASENVSPETTFEPDSQSADHANENDSQLAADQTGEETPCDEATNSPMAEDVSTENTDLATCEANAEVCASDEISVVSDHAETGFVSESSEADSFDPVTAPGGPNLTPDAEVQNTDQVEDSYVSTNYEWTSNAAQPEPADVNSEANNDSIDEQVAKSIEPAEVASPVAAEEIATTASLSESEHCVDNSEKMTADALQSVFESEEFADADFAKIAEAVEEATAYIEPVAIESTMETPEPEPSVSDPATQEAQSLEESIANVVSDPTGVVPEPLSPELVEVDAHSAQTNETPNSVEQRVSSGQTVSQESFESTLADDVRTSLQKTIDGLAQSLPVTDTPTPETDELKFTEVADEATDEEVFVTPVEPVAESIENQIVENVKEIAQQVSAAVEPAPAAVSSNEIQPDPNNQPVVMVVDDSPTIRKLVSMTLSRHGFNVISAVDGVDALKLLAEQRPDIILSDIDMPRLGGYQLCKFVRKHAKTKLIPVLLLSSKDGVFDKMRGKMAGANGHIAKPFESADLVHQVRQQLLSANAT